MNTEKSNAVKRAQLQQIDQLCDRFEAQVSAGRKPEMAHFLRSADDEVRPALFRELLLLDIECANEQKSAQDYISRYPEYKVQIEGVFVEITKKATNLASDSKTQPPSSSDQRSRTIGPYKLLQEIGEGGMGSVWMAEQQYPVRRRVALKLIKTGFDDRQVIARFEAERQAIAMMDHQNIAKVLGAGTTDDGLPYFVMELVQGVPINEFCDNEALSLRERLKLFVPVCKAVQHAHQKGIIHRDLKPTNVLVTRYDGEPVAKIIDFGLAKALQHQLQLTDKTMFTQYGQVVGTVQYMSPEQATLDAMDVDTRSDIYSLGILLYELLAGSTPISQETLKQHALLSVLEIIRESEPPLPSQRFSSSGDDMKRISERRRTQPAALEQVLRGDLDWIIMRALENDRSRRYETANSLAEDVQRYLAGETIEARPASIGYKLGKFVKKNRGLVATLATITVLLIAGIAGTTWFAFEAINQRNNANSETRRAQTAEAAAKKSADEARAANELTEQALARSQYSVTRKLWYENRIWDAMGLLDQIPEKHRNFEWYLDRQLLYPGSDLRLFGHRERIYSVAFRQDREQLATGSKDGTVKLWNLKTESLTHSLDKHTGAILSVVYTPNGEHLISASQDATIRLWNAQIGNQIQVIQQQHPISGLRISADGTQLVTSDTNNSIKLWDVSTGAGIQIHDANKGLKFDEAVTCVSLSRTGRYVVFGTGLPKRGNREGYGNVHVWDTSTGQDTSTLIDNSLLIRDQRTYSHAGPVRGVAYSPDGQRIASVSDDASVKLWDIVGSNMIRRLDGHEKPVHGLAFSPDGTTLASGGFDSTIRIWDARTGHPQRTIKTLNWVRSVEYSPDARQIACGVAKAVYVWNAESDNSHTFRSHSKTVSAVRFSPDGKWLASGAKDSVVLVWDAYSGQRLQRFDKHTAEITELAFAPNGNVLSASLDKSVHIWNPANGQLVSTLNHDSPVYSVDVSPDGEHIATGSQDGSAILWDANTGVEQSRWQHQGTVRCVKFHPRLPKVASAAADRIIKLRDIETGETKRFIGHDQAVYYLAFSPDGSSFASGSQDDTIRLWDLELGQRSIMRGNKGDVYCIAFHPNGTRLASASGDETVKLWDTSSGEEIRSISGHDDRVRTIAFSPDGTLLASGSQDSTVKIWDAHPKTESRHFRGHEANVKKLVFNQDGSQFFSRDESGATIGWDVETGAKISTETWEDQNAPTQWYSPDDRWQVILDGKQVMLLDTNYKNQPKQRGYRSFRTSLHPLWHSKKAAEAEVKQDWFAAMFHYAWVMKSAPEIKANYQNLHRSNRMWKKQRTKSRTDTKSEFVPAAIVQEMLKLPRGTKSLRDTQ